MQYFICKKTQISETVSEHTPGQCFLSRPTAKILLTFKNHSYIKFCRENADIAQLVELLICNQWVGSSSLSVGTIKPLVFQGLFLYSDVGRLLPGRNRTAGAFFLFISELRPARRQGHAYCCRSPSSRFVQRCSLCTERSCRQPSAVHRRRHA